MWKTVGQDRAIRLLETALKAGRLAHAYLFVGPEGVGKTTLALELAQAVNCLGEDDRLLRQAQDGVRTGPCGHCRQCESVAHGRHADVVLITPGRAETGIDAVREMEHQAALKPFEGRCRVFIFERAERLSFEASNALLKTLEEPPPDTLLLLLCASEEALLPTVRSRCQRVELRRIPDDVIAGELAKRLSLNQARANAVARMSRGRLGWALASQQEGTLEQREELLNRWKALQGDDTASRLALASELATLFSRERQACQEALSLGLELWRDLLLTRLGALQGVVNLEEGRLQSWATSLNTEEIKEAIRAILRAWGHLEQNANPRLALETLLISLPVARMS